MPFKKRLKSESLYINQIHNFWHITYNRVPETDISITNHLCASVVPILRRSRQLRTQCKEAALQSIGVHHSKTWQDVTVVIIHL
jgi:hypothetical protein